MTTDNQLVFFFYTQICNIEINYFVSAVQNAAVYERELYVVFFRQG